MSNIKEQYIAKMEAIYDQIDELMTELDGLSHVSERDQYENLNGQIKDLYKEWKELDNKLKTA